MILEALTRHGVQHICIAPGSRSTPLTLAAAENRAFIHHTHFDERGSATWRSDWRRPAGRPVAVMSHPPGPPPRTPLSGADWRQGSPVKS
ncbi:hypothetical protein LNQ03_27090 [Klebsiella pneumoniae subsp. pneumoniae]|nr:hypothetical protein [Klebsiella pneumoniae subsp. pneumoniae]